MKKKISFREMKELVDRRLVGNIWIHSELLNVPTKLRRPSIEKPIGHEWQANTTCFVKIWHFAEVKNVPELCGTWFRALQSKLKYQIDVFTQFDRLGSIKRNSVKSTNQKEYLVVTVSEESEWPKKLCKKKSLSMEIKKLRG